MWLRGFFEELIQELMNTKGKPAAQARRRTHIGQVSEIIEQGFGAEGGKKQRQAELGK